MFNLPTSNLGLAIMIPLIIIMLVWFVIWVLTLIYQAKRSQWAFFILTLIFNIVLIIYWIVWLSDSKWRKKR